MFGQIKNAVIKYALNTICGLSTHEYEFYFYQLGTEVKEIENISKEKLSFGGAYNSDSIEKLKKIIDTNTPIIFLTDGNMEPDIKLKLQTVENDIIPVWIGMDANISCLETFAKDKRVYSIPDIVQAIYSIVWGDKYVR